MLTECRKGPRARVYCRGGEGTPGEGLVRQTPDQASRNEDAAQIVIFYAAPHTHQAHPPIPTIAPIFLSLDRSFVRSFVRSAGAALLTVSNCVRPASYVNLTHYVLPIL